MLFCSSFNNVIRKVDLNSNYQTTTFAGPGNTLDPRGTNGIGTGMKIAGPKALAFAPGGSALLIADASTTIRIISFLGTGQYDAATRVVKTCKICPGGSIAKVAGSTECSQVRHIHIKDGSSCVLMLWKLHLSLCPYAPDVFKLGSFSSINDKLLRRPLWMNCSLPLELVPTLISRRCHCSAREALTRLQVPTLARRVQGLLSETHSLGPAFGCASITFSAPA